MTTASANTERAAFTVGRHQAAGSRHHTPAGLFTTENAYAVGLVQIATATSELDASANLRAGSSSFAGIVPRVARGNGR